MRLDGLLEILEGPNNAFESGRNVGEICNTTANYENFPALV